MAHLERDVLRFVRESVVRCIRHGRHRVACVREWVLGLEWLLLRLRDRRVRRDGARDRDTFRVA